MCISYWSVTASQEILCIVRGKVIEKKEVITCWSNNSRGDQQQVLGGLLISNKKEGQPASAITLSQLLHIRTIHEQSNTWLSETASNFLWRNLAPICEITLLCWLFLADKEAICCSGQFVFVENKKGRKEKYFFPNFWLHWASFFSKSICSKTLKMLRHVFW